MSKDKQETPLKRGCIICAKGSIEDVYVCKLAMDMFKLEEKDLWDECSGVLTVGDFYAMCGGENTQIIFT